MDYIVSGGEDETDGCGPDSDGNGRVDDSRGGEVDGIAAGQESEGMFSCKQL